MNKKIEKVKQAVGLSNKCRFCGSEREPHGFDEKSACPNRCEWKEWEKREALKIDTTDDYLADGLGYGARTMILLGIFGIVTWIVLISIFKAI